MRLDPFTLPVRFAVNDGTADGRVRVVELSRDHVVLRRAVRGIKMAVQVPVHAYLGVAIRMEPPTEDQNGAVTVVLEHRDPGLSLPLQAGAAGAARHCGRDGPPCRCVAVLANRSRTLPCIAASARSSREPET